jgi:hypothetical protein
LEAPSPLARLFGKMEHSAERLQFPVDARNFKPALAPLGNKPADSYNAN